MTTETIPLQSNGVPDWGSSHHPLCPVTHARDSLWTEYLDALAWQDSARRRDRLRHLWGAMLELTEGGDDEQESCTCDDQEPDAPAYPDLPLERILPLERMPLESLVAIISACALHVTSRLADRNQGDFNAIGFAPNREFAERNAEPLLRLADLWDRG